MYPVIRSELVEDHRREIARRKERTVLAEQVRSQRPAGPVERFVAQSLRRMAFRLDGVADKPHARVRSVTPAS